ncbi:hypothetical protein D3C78_1353800 [compost metagenome]
MGRRLLRVLGVLFAASSAAAVAFPPEVAEFIEGREVCEHFRQEPWPEGHSAEDSERREFISSQIERFCRGSDRALRQLKDKYKSNWEVMQRLEKYEEKINDE